MGGMIPTIKNNFLTSLKNPTNVKDQSQYVFDPGGLANNPVVPTPPVAPPPAPTADNSSGALDNAAQLEALRLQRGRAATVLTGGGGLQNMGSASSTLLGS